MLCIISDSTVSPFATNWIIQMQVPLQLMQYCLFLGSTGPLDEADDSSIIQSESPHKPNDTITA